MHKAVLGYPGNSADSMPDVEVEVVAAIQPGWQEIDRSERVECLLLDASNSRCQRIDAAGPSGVGVSEVSKADLAQQAAAAAASKQ